MGAISTSSLQLFSSHPSLCHHSGARGRTIMPSSTKFQKHARIRAQAFAESLVIAVSDTQIPKVGGDVSVLLPVSAVLVLFYWVTNFVVPGFISRDFAGREGSDKENTEE